MARSLLWQVDLASFHFWMRRVDEALFLNAAWRHFFLQEETEFGQCSHQSSQPFFLLVKQRTSSAAAVRFLEKFFKESSVKFSVLVCVGALCSNLSSIAAAILLLYPSAARVAQLNFFLAGPFLAGGRILNPSTERTKR